jgi:ribosome maturation factor RimP
LAGYEDFSRFQGSIVRVQLRETLDGQRNIKGKIDSLDGDKITLVTKEGNPVIFPFDLIRKANLVFEGKF